MKHHSSLSLVLFAVILLAAASCSEGAMELCSVSIDCSDSRSFQRQSYMENIDMGDIFVLTRSVASSHAFGDSNGLYVKYDGSLLLSQGQWEIECIWASGIDTSSVKAFTGEALSETAYAYGTFSGYVSKKTSVINVTIPDTYAGKISYSYSGVPQSTSTKSYSANCIIRGFGNS